MKNSFFEKLDTIRIEKGERISSAALSFNGEIFTGSSHAVAIVELEKKYPDWSKEIEGTLKDGFLTDTGRFVDRVEAEEIAERANQVDLMKNEASKHLNSEDLK